ncbi:MAG TPA: DUF2283 domain-containing protein [Armatimonadota bacterium]|jgi:hypothetical protein
MEERLTFRFDREGDILYVNRVPPYAEQESEELEDGVVARLKPHTGDVENWEVLFFSTRLMRDTLFDLPTHVSLQKAS